MRSFLALKLPYPDGVGAFAQRCSKQGADMKWVDPEQLHVTLRFLGDIPDAVAREIVNHVREADRPPPYTARLKGLGAFPNWKKVNVLWLGVQDEGNTDALASTAERAARQAGLDPERRPFHAHATIARRRGDRGLDIVRREARQLQEHEFGQAEIDAAQLFASTLTPEGPVYQVYDEVRL